MPFPDRILFATDGSATAHLAHAHAVDLARTTGAEVHVVHVGSSPPGPIPVR